MGSASHRAPSPLRQPETISAPQRSKRALILVLLTIFFPGSAQLVAGNRKLGRLAVSITMLCWVAILGILAIYFINRSVILGWVAHPNFQLFLIIVLGSLAVGWFIMFINTLVIIRPGMLAPGMRAIVTVFTLAAVVATSGVFIYGASLLNTGRETIVSVFDEGPAFDPIDGRYNIAVFGADSGSNREGVRTDSVALLSVDAKTGKTLLISVPRNFQGARFADDSPMKKIWPEGYNCGNDCIFNAIYRNAADEHADAFPASVKNVGAQAAMDALEGTTGLPVQGYVMVDMAGFEQFVDALGGVTINSGGWVPYNGKYYPNSTVRTHWFAPGTQTFNGKHALWFARSRDFTDDYHRIKRQQCLQQAIIKQFTPQTILTNFTSIMSAGEQLVETNIPAGQLGSFVSLAEKVSSQPMARLTLGAPDFERSFSTYPDFDKLQERIRTLIAKQSESEKKKTEKSDSSKKSENSSKASESPKSSESEESTEESADTTDINNAPKLSGGGDQEFTQPDGSPITEEYLVQLEMAGYNTRISQIAANNDECSVP
ncbi:LytR family transcriptional regulator [Glutamicibacter halophytocola]|uniref:LytR family transcriptional regulator n=1 Tax=Glutamicibacter halophytocola TaxID=1933880 RepID=A0ABX5YD15_9MICC|nr:MULTISPECIES: LCP family protein [Glutamicibacter]MBF6671347.1 LCP family protein [Glutamicibacter sp. FBE19]QDY67555.1 LytR family transcriptional regulator [Glutamicibacter halophytocola]